jgi:hypothetical protein
MTSTTNNIVASKFRLRILHFWQSLQDCSVDIVMYEQQLLSGKLLAVDLEQQLIHVSQLKTPLYTYDVATLRLADVISIRRRVQ